jgi:hypothetical protein
MAFAKKLAAGVIFRPRRAAKSKDAALTFHQPVALHRARSGAASTRSETPTPLGPRVGAARTFKFNCRNLDLERRHAHRVGTVSDQLR